MDLQTVQKKPEDEAMLRRNLNKLLEADKDLVRAKMSLTDDLATLVVNIRNLQTQHDDLIPVSQDIVKNIAVVSVGANAIQRQLNRRSAERLASQKRAVDGALVDLKLRINELTEAVKQLKRSLAEAERARQILLGQIAKIKGLLGEAMRGGLGGSV